MSQERKSGSPGRKKGKGIGKVVPLQKTPVSSKRKREEKHEERRGSLSNFPAPHSDNKLVSISGKSASANSSLTFFSPPPSTKKPKIVSPKAARRKDYIEAFSSDQNEVYEYLTETLVEAFFEATLIAKGKLTLADSQSRAKDIVNVAVIAGGASMPFVGGAISGISLLTYMVRQGLQERQENIQRDRVGRINTFVSGGHKRIYKISSDVAILVCGIYGDQIEKLSSQGKQQFVNFIVGIMFDHIINGCPRPQSFLQSVGENAIKVLKWMLYSISPSLIGAEPDPEFVHPAVSMLEGLIFFRPAPSTLHRLNVKEEFAERMAFYIEGILQSNIRTPFGEFYVHSAASDVYGYRVLPQMYAEGLKYTRLKNSSEATPVYPASFKRIQFETFCSFEKEENFKGKFNDELADNALAVNGLRRGAATGIGNNCLLDTYFELVNDYFERNHPNLVLNDFEQFANFVRERIDRTDGGMLSINDEEEGVRILLAVQEYLRLNCSGFMANFDLEVYIPDREGDLGMVDNIRQIQDQVNRNRGEHIPLRVIQTNFDHYDPVFRGHADPQEDNRIQRRLSMN